MKTPLRLTDVGLTTRLVGISLVPLCALTVAMGSSALDDLNQLRSARQVVDLVDLAQKSTSLVHALQAERGATNTYVASAGAKMKDKLPGLRQASTGALAELTAYVGNTELPDDVRSQASGAAKKVDALADVRTKADSLSIAGPDLVSAYTSSIASVLSSVGNVAAASTNPETSRELLGLSALSEAKENAGRERAQLSGVLAKGSYAPGQQTQIAAFPGAISALMAAYARATGDAGTQSAEELQGSPTWTKVTDMENKALAATGGFSIKSEDWFAASTARIDALRSIETSTYGAVREHAEGMAADVQRSLVVLVSLLALILGVTAAMTLALIRSITGAVRRVQDVMEEMAQGRFTSRVEVVGTDEMAKLSTDVNAVVDAMNAALEEISGDARKLTTSVSTMSGASEMLRSSAEGSAKEADGAASSAEQVSGDVSSVAAAAEQLGASIQEIARSTTAAQDIAQRAVTLAESAGSTISELGDSSERIGDVLKTVSAIAGQTNLLALNATIEAARAGEAGKGFAVVASEVKDLAQETSRATDDISNQIAKIQGDAAAAVASILQIGEIIGEMAGVQSAIAAAVEEQTVTTRSIEEHVHSAAGRARDIADSVSLVAQATRSTSAGAEQTSSAVGQVIAIADELDGIVGRFQLAR